MEAVAAVNGEPASNAGGAEAEAGVPMRRVSDLPPSDRALAADHVRGLFQQGAASLVGNMLGIAVMGAMFAFVAPPLWVTAWVGVGLVLWTGRLLHWRRFIRARDPDAATLLRWRRTWEAMVLAQGVLWGVASWLFYGQGTTFHTIALIVTIYAFCLGSVQLLGTQPRIFTAYVAVVLLPMIARVASDTREPWHWQLAAVLALQFVITVILGRTYRGAFEATVELKVRTEQLAAQLRVEKTAADEARAAAEAASRAKTQFFAAASHDLRQPLHAMGLFAEALRQRIRDPEVASLVNSINESVDALEGLFGELLDITRIDSGGVDVHPQPVPVRELFARLKLHFEPAAFEKGLALRFHGERHVLHTDPVLVERILRNLVSNAIRYTEDGGVLVACRRRGERLVLQVWDSGIGVAEAALPRIFDEFFQVASARPLEAHDRKGLGLGLAIVQRLAGLLEAPLRVRSVPGRGTVFDLEVPAGRMVRAAVPPASSAKPMSGLTLEGRRIMVVEDEGAVREGLNVLLGGWGAEVLAFDGAPSVHAWLAGEPGRAPDLLICDYRLPGAQTGVDVIDAVRTRLGGTIPAIVVTGSMVIGHEAAAVAHDFHLLVKPVVPHKLRAMIAFKLGLR